MKPSKISMAIVLALFLLSPFLSEAVDPLKGKNLFSDPNLGGGTTGKSCNSCHPDGKGLEKSAEKKEFNVGGGKAKNLAEAINVCIEKALKGKPLERNSENMSNLIVYIKSFKAKAAAATAPKKEESTSVEKEPSNTEKK